MARQQVSAVRSPLPTSIVASITTILWLALVMGILVGAVAWFLPVEVFESWAVESAKGDALQQIEAYGRAEAGCWVARFAGPLLAIISIVILNQRFRFENFVASATTGWFRITQVASTRNDSNAARRASWKTMVLRGFCVAWAGLALGHYGQALSDSLSNWTFYRLRAGVEMLPNMSESNILVIRYLLAQTKPGDRIFVASDQKLYFLSYYLLPRRLYYESHPDSEFVIPLAHQQRRMAAFQLAEIDPKVIDRIAPDYILEYFEHPDFVDQTRKLEDSHWISHFRAYLKDSHKEPAYFVSLHRVEKDRQK